MKKNHSVAISITFCILFYWSMGYTQPEQANAITKRKPIVVTSETVDLRKTGLRVYKPEKCWNGYVLYNHLPFKSPPSEDKSMPSKKTFVMTPIFLIDMDGEIVYQWTAETMVSFARLTADSHLFYITKEMPDPGIYDPGESGVRELDLQSNVVWFYPAFTHHDFRILDDDNILIGRYENVQPDPKSPPIFAHRIEIITRNKEIIWSWKAEEHMKEMEELAGIKIDPFKKGDYEPEGDWFHNNTCAILPDNQAAKKDPRFRKGNVVFCSFTLNIIGVIDYQTKEVVWAWGPGIVDGPHSPVMLDNGNFLIFDNGRHRKWSRVIEVDPLTGEIVWEYHAEPKESFYSSILSAAEPLPNGNIFIYDSTHCRIFEITPQGEIIWDFISTYDRMNTEAIVRANKYSPDYVKPVLKAAEKYSPQYIEPSLKAIKK